MLEARKASGAKASVQDSGTYPAESLFEEESKEDMEELFK
jgi:hypothetical protein